MHAIVTDGLWRKSLSAIRSLGKSGYDVCVLGDSVFTTGFWSSYTRHQTLAPTAARNPEAFGRALLRTLTRTGGAVILPMEDASLEWVSAHAEEITAAGGRMLLPPPESLKLTRDKGATIRIAGELGLPVPQTWRPETAEAFARKALELKPEEFVAKPITGTGSAGVVYGKIGRGAPDADAWKAHWARFGAMLIQERIPAEGKGQGVSVLMGADGECAAAFAHERLEQYPNSGGPSTDRMALKSPELIEMSLKLLKKLNWRGIAMVEWKLDPRDGKPKLMEINPRFWGSLELAVRSGVDFPSLYASAALGEKLGPPFPYPNDVRCRWMMPGEFLRYFTMPRHAREGLREFIRGLPEEAEEWDTSDLRGSLATVVCTVALALNPRYWKYVLRG